jgi:hypothetical protein
LNLCREWHLYQRGKRYPDGRRQQHADGCAGPDHTFDLNVTSRLDAKGLGLAEPQSGAGAFGSRSEKRLEDVNALPCGMACRAFTTKLMRASSSSPVSTYTALVSGSMRTCQVMLGCSAGRKVCELTNVYVGDVLPARRLVQRSSDRALFIQGRMRCSDRSSRGSGCL